MANYYVKSNYNSGCRALKFRYGNTGGNILQISRKPTCGVALFFSVYVWPRVSEVIGKVIEQLTDAAKS